IGQSFDARFRFGYRGRKWVANGHTAELRTGAAAGELGECIGRRLRYSNAPTGFYARPQLHAGDCRSVRAAKYGGCYRLSFDFDQRPGAFQHRYLAQRGGTSPLITPAGVVNAGSFAGGGVSPGEIVTVFGSNIGPLSLAGVQVADGQLTTSAGGTQVLFDGTPAPMI